MRTLDETIRRRLWILVLVPALAACGHRGSAKDAGASAQTTRHGLSAEQAREVLAKVGPREITLGEFADRLAEQSPYLRARFSSPERRRELLDNMVRFELLALEAEHRGYAQDPDVARAERQALVQALLKHEIDDRVKLEDVTDAEIAAYYAAHPTEYHQPPQVRASHLRFADRAAAQRALDDVRAHPADMDLFRRLARESSNDASTRPVDGDLRFFGRPATPAVAGEPPPSVANAAFEIDEVGGVYPRVVQADDGFHVVKLTAKRPALDRSLEDVKPIVRNLLWREKREAATRALVERLRREAHVEEDAAALATVRIPTDAPATQATPPGVED